LPRDLRHPEEFVSVRSLPGTGAGGARHSVRAVVANPNAPIATSHPNQGKSPNNRA